MWLKSDHNENTWINPLKTKLILGLFRHLKLELLAQFPASNDEKHVYWKKIDIQ